MRQRSQGYLVAGALALALALVVFITSYATAGGFACSPTQCGNSDFLTAPTEITRWTPADRIPITDDPDLIAYLPFDNGTCTSVAGVIVGTGTQTNLTFARLPSFSGAPTGNQFMGWGAANGDRCQFTVGVFDAPTKTVMFMARTTSDGTGGQIIDAQASALGWGIDYNNATDQLLFYSGDDITSTNFLPDSSKTWPTGEWHHYAVRLAVGTCNEDASLWCLVDGDCATTCDAPSVEVGYTPGTVEIFVVGAEACPSGTCATGHLPQISGGSFSIGDGSGSQAVNVVIDELAVVGTLLTAEEICEAARFGIRKKSPDKRYSCTLP